MEKGKCRNKKNYISVMFVPHDSSSVITFRVKSLYVKVLSVVAILALFGVSGSLFLRDTINRNIMLQDDIAYLYSTTFRQKNLIYSQGEIIHEKEDQIASLNNKLSNQDSFIHEKIDEVMSRYKELTESYITGLIDTSTASRSGDRNEKTFTQDIKELKEILIDLSSDYNAQSETTFDSPSYSAFDLSDSTQKLEQYLETIPHLWPSEGGVCSPFGHRKHPITGIWQLHTGIDIASQYGWEVRASADGTVIKREYYGGYGYTIMIDHGDGISTLYAHLSKMLVKDGQTVKAGELIAKVGQSGRATGPHLHFEVRLNNNPVNPIGFLDDK